MASYKQRLAIELREKVNRSARIVRECSYEEMRHYAAGQLAAFQTALDLVVFTDDGAPPDPDLLPAGEVPVR